MLSRAVLRRAPAAVRPRRRGRAATAEACAAQRAEGWGDLLPTCAELDFARRGDRAGILVVSFVREKRLNSINEGMADGLLALCDKLQGLPPGGVPGAGNVRCVVFTGQGRAFSTGRDLKESATHTQEDATRYLSKCIAACDAMAALPMPTIAAVNGPCFGWGVEAALACDIRLAADDATLCFPETRLGLFPGAGGTPRAAQLLPLTVAKELIFTARPVKGDEAQRLGLVSRCVPRDSLLPEAESIAQLVENNGPLGVRGAKRVLNRAVDVALDEALAYSRRERMPLNDTADFAEGIRAFAEKRAPEFVGA